VIKAKVLPMMVAGVYEVRAKASMLLLAPCTTCTCTFTQHI